MKHKSRLVAALYQLTICLLSAFGVLAVCGLLAKKFDFAPLRQYVLFADAVCAVFFGLSFLCRLFSSKEFLPRLRGAVVMLLCFSVLMDIAGLAGPRSSSLSYILLHALVPAMALSEWILFAKKGSYRWISPVLWLILPNLYFLYVILRAKYLPGAGWLYPFLDLKTVGLRQFAKDLLSVNIPALALGFLIVSIDKLAGKRARKRSAKKKDK